MLVLTPVWVSWKSPDSFALFSSQAVQQSWQQNAIPAYCSSPLPVSTGHSILPYTTDLKILPSHPICSEYPTPDPSVFIWFLPVAAIILLYSHKTLKEVVIRSSGETEPREPLQCVKWMENPGTALFLLSVLKLPQDELSNTSGLSLAQGI